MRREKIAKHSARPRRNLQAVKVAQPVLTAGHDMLTARHDAEVLSDIQQQMENSLGIAKNDQLEITKDTASQENIALLNEYHKVK